MAVGKYRFLYQNRIDINAIIGVNSLRDGHVINAIKRGSGSATLNVGNIFTNIKSVKYTVRIDDISVGQEVGQSTYEWFKDDILQASGITTTGSTSLSDGVTINFNSGTGNDFDLGDQWDFFGINEFAPGKVFDLDRDSRYRSRDNSITSGTITMSFDLGSSQTFDSFEMMDHNVSASGTITLKAGSVNDISMATFSQNIVWNQTKILQYFTQQNLQYVWVQIDDLTNADGFFETSNIYVGIFKEHTRALPLEFDESQELIINRQESNSGVVRRQFKGSRRAIKASVTLLRESDETEVFFMLDTITNLNNQTIDNILFNFDSEDVGEHWLMELSSIPITITNGNQFGVVYHTMIFNLKEIVRSV